MRNEDRSVIRLTHSFQQSSVTFYNIQIQHGFKLYRLSCRYSKLRKISTMLPKTEAKFPEPDHLKMAVCSLLGNKSVLTERYEKLTKYFADVSKLPQLAENRGFKLLLEESELLEDMQDKNQEVVPQAPRSCGRKLCPRQYAGQLLIVIG